VRPCAKATGAAALTVAVKITQVKIDAIKALINFSPARPGDVDKDASVPIFIPQL
jgi:hypothetical protein